MPMADDVDCFDGYETVQKVSSVDAPSGSETLRLLGLHLGPCQV
jgi:hypothetical protein